MTLKLVYNQSASVPLEIEGITPDAIRNLTISAIEKIKVFHGKEESHLGDFFKVSGKPGDEILEIEGDLSGVHWIGAKMNSGQIRIAGNCGRHLGSEMKGGTIHIEGNASDWVGAEMRGGLIHVLGRAGHLIGAAYRGSAVGMRGGTIMIEGDVGNEIGHTMRRGTLSVGGNAGDLAGFNMLAGSILVFGNGGIRHGAAMRRGTIGFFGDEKPVMLPTFTKACQINSDILNLMFRDLSRKGFLATRGISPFEIDVFNGDQLEGGRGEILVRV